MSQASSSSELGKDAETLLFQFDQAWQKNSPPKIDDYLARIGPEGRRGLLEELVKIDLEYRWRRQVADSGPKGLPLRPRLEDYVKQYPLLGQLHELSLNLITGEYFVRQVCGDRPRQAEYVSRFPRQGAKLLTELSTIDAELSAEQARNGSPISTGITAQPPARAPDQPVLNVSGLVAMLGGSPLLTAPQKEELSRRLAGRFTEPRALAGELLRRGWLTAYQVNLLLQGRISDLLLGPYVLLERLGEGGAGQVFKARHLQQQHLVALKVIRKELLADPEVVGRFHRETHVLSQLDHPNVVKAFDAGTAGSTHYLAMEFVEGTDLGRLVKKNGPMPVHQACAYIHQAALGLQHAHERELVHRDIKPHNLIMSVRDGLIKVADLGLARLPRGVNPDMTVASDPRTTGTLTPENAVMMGTADYLAPEQALNFHTADIRADIYSLGCTLHFLLTGQPPFPGGNLAQKVAKHMQAEPPVVARQDLPAGLADVVRKMLAKRPEDRFQTPAEVAKVLAPLAKGHETRLGPKWLSRFRPFLKRRRVPLAIGAVIALGLLLILLVRQGELTEPKKLDEFKVKKQDYLHALAFSPNAKLVANGGGDTLISIWDPAADKQTDRKLFTLAGHKDGISHLALSADGRHLASGSGDGKTWKIWDLKAQREVASGQAELVTRLHMTRPYVGPFSPDGKVVAICHGEGTVGLVDTTGKEINKITLKELPIALAFSTDSRSLAVVVGRLQIFDINSGKELVSGNAGGYVHALAFSPDNSLLAVARSNYEVQILDAGTLKSRWIDKMVVPRALPSRTPLVFLAFTPDGKLLACGGFDHKVKVWDVETGKERFTFAAVDSYTKPICGMAMSPDGRTLLVGGEDDIIRVWRIR